MRKTNPDIDIERGNRFAELGEKIFPGVSRTVIGKQLGGYSESTVRRWEEGLGLPNKALIALLEYDVSLKWLLTGEGEQIYKTTPAAPAGATSDVTRLFSSLMEAHRALALLGEKVCAGEIEPKVAHLAVAAALKIVWQAHGKPSQAGKRQRSS